MRAHRGPAIEPAVGAHLAAEAGSVVGDAFWLATRSRVRSRRRVCQNVALPGRLAGTTPTESAQKMYGKSILVERLYTG